MGWFNSFDINSALEAINSVKKNGEEPLTKADHERYFREIRNKQVPSKLKTMTQLKKELNSTDFKVFKSRINQ